MAIKTKSGDYLRIDGVEVHFERQILRIRTSRFLGRADRIDMPRAGIRSEYEFTRETVGSRVDARTETILAGMDLTGATAKEIERIETQRKADGDPALTTTQKAEVKRRVANRLKSTARKAASEERWSEIHRTVFEPGVVSLEACYTILHGHPEFVDAEKC